MYKAVIISRKRIEVEATTFLDLCQEVMFETEDMDGDVEVEYIAPEVEEEGFKVGDRVRIRTEVSYNSGRPRAGDTGRVILSEAELVIVLFAGFEWEFRVDGTDDLTYNPHISVLEKI